MFSAHPYQANIALLMTQEGRQGREDWENSCWYLLMLDYFQSVKIIIPIFDSGEGPDTLKQIPAYNVKYSKVYFK